MNLYGTEINIDDIRKKVFDEIDRNQNQIIETELELASIPAYADFTKPQDEWEMAKVNYIEHKCKEAGLDTVRGGEIPNGRFQFVIGFLRGRERRTKIAYHAHIDSHPEMR